MRGTKKNSSKLNFIGQKCIRILLSTMKNCDNDLYKLEQKIFSQLTFGATLNPNLKLKKLKNKRVLSEMQKQNLVKLTKIGYVLTPLGKWYQSKKIKTTNPLIFNN